MPGETACGDACRFWLGPDRIVMTVADGLGHGPGAAEAAGAALRCVGALRQQPCAAIFAECDHRLLRTRGVALAVAIVEPRRQRLTLATVGNIRAVLLSEGRELHLGGAPGIVGAGFNGLAPERVDLVPGDLLLLYSDGLEEFLPLNELPLERLSAHEIAETALARWARNTDDAGILVYMHG